MSDTGNTGDSGSGVTLSERGVVIEGQRIASVMSDGARALLAHAPLIILPDVGASWGEYRAVLEHFAGSRRVFALDWPGFGGSARPSPEEFAYTLAHFTDVFE